MKRKGKVEKGYVNFLFYKRAQKLSFFSLVKNIHSDKVFCVRKPLYASSGQPVPYYCGNCSWNQPAQRRAEWIHEGL